MEDDSAIKKAGIAKLNGSNYRTWAAITRAVIEAKDAWDAIEPLGLGAETPGIGTDDGIIKGKVAELSKIANMKANRVMDVKARIIIIRYYRQEALSRILYLRIVKE